MIMRRQYLEVCLLSVVVGTTAQSTVGAYGQCGGSGYVGPTACATGYTCTTYNPYYYQCVPGTATTTTPVSTKSSTSTAGTSTSTTVSTVSTSSRPVTTSATSTASTPTSTAGTPTTLQSGWYWIRAVESPYYHSYLQSQPTATPADAVLDDASTAGQFNIVSGQLAYNTGSNGGSWYMWVEDPTDKTQRSLRTWFNTTANPYGTFAFSGDTVTWTDPDVARPNTAAFYVCPDDEENALFVNTGAYLYNTPAGCYDVDIHSYGGSTANI